MAAYDITAPDGRKFRINAPDGATQEEVLAYAKANIPPAQQQPKADVEDPGALMSLVISAGRTGDKLVQGVKQAALNVPAMLGSESAQKTLADMKAQQAGADEVYKGLSDKRPWATGIGEALPLVAAPMLASGIGGAALSSAIPGLIAYGTTEEKLKQGALGAAGGALGATAGKALGAVLQPFKAQTTATAKAAQEAADRLGVQLRPGEITGSRPLRWAESSLNDLPFASGMAQKAETARTAAINRAAAKAIGQNSDEITEATLSNARDQIGGVFDSLLANRKITLDNAFQNEVKAISGSKVMRALRNEEVDAIIGPFKNIPQGGRVNVSGEWFQQNKTALDSAIRTAYNAGESGKARALEQFEKALERAATRSMNADEAAAFKAAQKQWASLRMLETGKVIDGGNVMPGRLDSALTSRYKAAYKEGKIKGELADIGRLSQAYKPLPQSGTVPRAFYSGVAGGAAFAEPVSGAAMLAAPPLVQKLMQSDAGRQYLTRGLMEMTPELEKQFMRVGGGLLGLPAIVASGRQ